MSGLRIWAPLMEFFSLEMFSLNWNWCSQTGKLLNLGSSSAPFPEPWTGPWSGSPKVQFECWFRTCTAHHYLKPGQHLVSEVPMTVYCILHSIFPMPLFHTQMHLAFEVLYLTQFLMDSLKYWTVHSSICNLDVWYTILSHFQFMFLDSWSDFCESNSSSKPRTP